jgi:hypothetical protein
LHCNARHYTIDGKVYEMLQWPKRVAIASLFSGFQCSKMSAIHVNGATEKYLANQRPPSQISAIFAPNLPGVWQHTTSTKLLAIIHLDDKTRVLVVTHVNWGCNALSRSANLNQPMLSPGGVFRFSWQWGAWRKGFIWWKFVSNTILP